MFWKNLFKIIEMNNVDMDIEIIKCCAEVGIEYLKAINSFCSDRLFESAIKVL